MSSGKIVLIDKQTRVTGKVTRWLELNGALGDAAQSYIDEVKGMDDWRDADAAWLRHFPSREPLSSITCDVCGTEGLDRAVEIRTGHVTTVCTDCLKIALGQHVLDNLGEF